MSYQEPASKNLTPEFASTESPKKQEMSNTVSSAVSQMLKFRRECAKENRYNELDKITQVFVDRLINSIASAGSSIPEERMIELLKQFEETVSEETRKGMTLECSKCQDLKKDGDWEDEDWVCNDCLWEDIYFIADCDEISDFLGDHKHLQGFKRHRDEQFEYRTTYYQTHGGSPEGGYFVKVAYPLTNGLAIGEGKKTVFRVERKWGTPFIPVKLLEKKLIYEPEDEMKGHQAKVRLVNVPATL